jgi:branched-chain amino acid aminotransferase
MALKIWLGNALVDENEAKVSVFDHGLLYGDGVFEGIRVYSGKVFELKAHLDRLYESAKVIRLQIAMTLEQMTDAVQTTVKANAVTDGYIRLIVTRGIGDLGLNPLICKGGWLSSLPVISSYIPEEFYEKG